jgi:hypothetical protein
MHSRNSLDKWLGFPEVICSVEEYFKIKRQSLLKRSFILPNKYVWSTCVHSSILLSPNLFTNVSTKVIIALDKIPKGLFI